MALKLNFREVTPEDTEILRMIALRNGKAEDYLCCDVTNEDGVTQSHPGRYRNSSYDSVEKRESRRSPLLRCYQ